MAITATERTQIVELVTLMFNAAPGATYLSQIVSLYESNGHNLQTLAEQLGTTSVFQSLNPNFQTAAEFASSFLTPLGLQGDAFATDFIVSRFNAGVSKADIMYQGFQALNSVGSGAASQYVNAQAILMNKEAVAEYYTVTANGNATDLSTLQNVLTGVTADASTVTAAENVINGNANNGQQFVLATGIDNLTGTSGNDTFIATMDNTVSPASNTLNVGDSINGGAGIDTLQITTASTSTVDLRTANITNIEKVFVNDANNSLNSDIYLGNNGFTDVTLQNLDNPSVYGINEGTNLTLQAAAGGTYNWAYVYFNGSSAATVNMNDTLKGNATASDSHGYIYHGDSSGGLLSNATTVNDTLNLVNANTLSGSDDWVNQYVHVDNAGNVKTAVNLNVNVTGATSDGSNDSGLTLEVYQNGDATVTANINVSNSDDVSTNVYAQENGVTTDASKNVANVTLNNVTNDSYSDVEAFDFAKVNVNVTGASSLDLLDFANSNATLTATSTQTLTITAGANLTVGATDMFGTGSTNVVVSGSGNVALGDFTGTGSTLSSTVSNKIDASALTGNFSVNVTDAIQSVLGGSGNDSIYIENVTTAGSSSLGGLTLNGGAGTDTLGFNVGDWNTTIAGLGATDLAKITNFEVLALHGALTTGTYDVSAISGITSFSALSGVLATNTASVTNLGAGTTVTLAGDLVTNNGNLALAMKTDTTADTLNLIVKPTFADNNNTTADNNVVTETVSAPNFETLNFTSTAKQTSAFTPTAGYKADYVTNALSLTDNQLKSLVVTGDQSFAFAAAAAQTALTSVDASANTASHGVQVDMSLDTKAVTLLGSTGKDTLIGTAKADTINGGAGNDTITGGSGADTLTGGAGNDTFVYTAIPQSTLLNLDTITDFSANTWGQGLDSVTSLPNGSATAAGADPTSAKINGDLINLNAIDTNHTLAFSVQANASDAQTYIQNAFADATAATTNVALDSSSGNLYIDVNNDGNVDMVIHLTGVTTLTTAAIVA
jgi:hypothetical protein